MRLYNDDSLKFSVVVFPFLKTTQEIKIGGFTFRSTDSIEELPPEQARCITEIANTLFLQDNFRIKSASYAIIPCVDVDDLPDEIHTHLRNIQSVVAYHYCYPRHEFGDIFLSSEHASLVIFTPCRFPQYLINRDFHTNLVGDDTSIFANKNNEIDGYAGLYNLQHPFWVA